MWLRGERERKGKLRKKLHYNETRVRLYVTLRDVDQFEGKNLSESG